MTVGDLARELHIPPHRARKIAEHEIPEFRRIHRGLNYQLKQCDVVRLRAAFLAAKNPPRPALAYLPRLGEEEAQINEITVQGDRRMTVREMAEALGTAESTIRNKAKELFPERVENGKTTFLTGEEAHLIKKNLVPRDLTLKSKVEAATSEHDIAEMTAKVLGYWKAKADELAAKVEADAPKIESFDALMRSERTMSITDAAKHFGLHPKCEVFPYLRARGYLTRDDLPTQAAIDAGYLSLKETKSQDGKVWPQAVVEAWQLENWRAHVVHQIKRHATGGAES